MSTDNEPSTSDAARRGDLPSGRPVSEDDHRTLADRLTGRGGAPEQDEHTAALDDEQAARLDDEHTAGLEDEHTTALDDDHTAGPDDEHTVRLDDEGGSGRGVEQPPAERATDHADTRPLDTQTTTDTQPVPPPGDVRVERQHPGGYPERSATAPDRRTVVERQKEDFGGVKVGAAFFGWLAATGLAVLLTALVAAVGAAVGVTDANLDEVTRRAGQDLGSIGLAGGIALLVILFVAYYAGGYVAGRMARFNGIRQGFAVWLWAVLIAAVVAAAAAIWGSKYDILSTLNSFPRWPVDQGTVTTGGVIALVILALASLVGALLGGLAGMHFHRRIDKVGLGH